MSYGYPPIIIEKEQRGQYIRLFSKENSTEQAKIFKQSMLFEMEEMRFSGYGIIIDITVRLTNLNSLL